MAWLTALFRAETFVCGPLCARLTAAAAVPRRVRKSFAVKSSPVRSLTYSLMSALDTGCQLRPSL
ncbi:hypothetical protein SRABI128_05553 [Microbacterium sp. Bi128]|nr:hypothetical protein SRABI128_05553 [Microbacterium sp. Bi128]